MNKKSIEDVLEQLTTTLICSPGIIGTAISLHEGEPCIVVYVSDAETEVLKTIPEDIDGFHVEVVRTDNIIANE